MTSNDFVCMKLPQNKLILLTKKETNLIIKVNPPATNTTTMASIILNDNDTFVNNIKRGLDRYQSLINCSNPDTIWSIDKEDIPSLLKEIDKNVPAVYNTMSNLPTDLFRSIMPMDNILALTYLLCAFTISSLKETGTVEVGPSSIIETLHLNDYFIEFTRFIFLSNLPNVN